MVDNLKCHSKIAQAGVDVADELVANLSAVEIVACHSQRHGRKSPLLPQSHGPSFIAVYRPLSLQPIESCSKGLENGDHCGRGFRATFNENIFGFELGAFRVETFRERTYAAVAAD